MPDIHRHGHSLEQRLDHYWDAVLAGPGDPPGEDIDADLAATVQRVHALDAEPPVSPLFASKLWEDLMHAQTANAAAAPSTALSINAPRWLSVFPGRWTGEGRRSSLSRIAAAILLVALLAGSAFAALYPLRPRGGDGLPLFAISETATVVPDGPVALEFLWRSTGGPEPLAQPYGLGIAPDGNVWVADGGNDRFQILAPDGTFLETWGTSGSGEGQFEFIAKRSPRPRGYGDVAFDREGNIYVLDTGNFRVQKFAPDRTFLLAWGNEGTGNGEFVTPGGISVSADGMVYVNDEARGDIQKFDRDGQWLDTIGERGAAEGQFTEAAGVAVDSTGDVWIADFSNHRIQRFGPDGEVADVWGEYGPDEGQFAYPADVAVDALGRVYVADMENSRLQVFTAAGQFLATIGDVVGPVPLWSPMSVAVNRDGMVFVTDDTGVQAFRVHFPADSEPMP